ncbi:microtubule associated-domain-containing protein [Ephemerocybe angulata]|uniref:Microtubule associated-domain-containing protein n=1 Tax=Ephemerocybe angulata TaxID=980116 RepID=A0A8H6MDI9_9AGAR|nr:microtubule associated-domain-containing protein [Tulosesus angulatus]
MPALTVSGRMAAAPNSHDPTSPGEEPSFSSSLSHPDFSLGSFASGISTPHRSNLNVTAGYLRPPRLSGRAGSSSTLVPGSASQLGKASVTGKDVEEYAGLLHDDEVTAEEAAMGDSIGPGSVLDTPGPKPKGVRTRSGTVTAAAAPSKVSKLTLRDQEKHIDNLKKENFSIKLRVHFLEDQLARMAPDQMDAALKQNINLKIEVQQRGMEIKKLKKLVLSLEHELERVQRGAAASAGASEREKELEQRLEEKERELRDLRRRKAEREDGDDALREAEARNAELEDELDNVKGLLEDNMDEIDRLKNIVQQRGSDKAEELENENYELREKLRAQDDLVSQLQDDRDDLQDALTELQLRLEELESRRHAESIERSHSRAALLDEQEAHEELEDEVNQLRDRVAALMIELQGREAGVG